MEASYAIRLGSMTSICLGISIIVRPQGTRFSGSFELGGRIGRAFFSMFKVSINGKIGYFGRFFGHLVGFKFVKVSFCGPFRGTHGMFIFCTRLISSPFIWVRFLYGLVFIRCCFVVVIFYLRLAALRGLIVRYTGVLCGFPGVLL